MGHPPVDHSVKQSPHVFIPAACLPVKQPTIKHLEALRAKYVATKVGSRHVFMDDTGYFVTFPNNEQGRYQQALWLKTNEGMLVFGKYRLGSMVSFPSEPSRNVADAGTSNEGGSNADMTAMNVRSGDEDEHSTSFPPDDVSFSIRGAAAVGSRKPTTPQGADSDGFTIKGAASALSPHLSTESPISKPPFSIRKEQVHHDDSLVSPQFVGTHAASNKIIGTGMEPPSRAGSMLRQERDDASSSFSGAAGSDVSGSKTPECHICKTRVASLVKCSSCTRYYHNHCHTDPPIPQPMRDEWQCRRCKYKGVPLKRSSAQADSPVLGPSALKKQRLSGSDSPLLGEAIDANSNGSELNLHASSSAAPQRIEARNYAANDASSGPFTNMLDHQLGSLDNDVEADNLVAESFANAPVGVAPKRGVKLNAVKRKISVPGVETQGERDERPVSASVADQTHLTAASAFVPHPGDSTTRATPNDHQMAQSPEVQIDGPAKAISVENNATIHTTNGDRPSGSKKAKKTQGSMKLKCSICRMHSVPFNPLGRSICQSCKDPGANDNRSLEPKATDPVAQSALSKKPTERESMSIGDVEPAEPTDGRTEDLAEEVLRTITASHAVPTTVDPPTADQTTSDIATIEGVAMVDLAAVDQATAKSTTVDPTIAGPPTVVAQATLGDQAAAADLEAGSFGSPPPREKVLSDSPLSDADASDSTDEDDNVALSDLIRKRSLNPKLESQPPLPVKEKRRRQNKITIAKDEYDLGDSFERPRNTYRRLIHMAISEAPNGRLKSSQITQWIGSNVPHYTLKKGSWAEGVKSTLIFASDDSGKKGNGARTLVRYGPGGGEDWYEILPEWKDKVDRWDAARSRPVSRLPEEQQEPNASVGKTMSSRALAGEPASKLANPTQSTGLLTSIDQATKKQGKRPTQAVLQSESMDIDDDSVLAPASSPEEPLSQLSAQSKAVAHGKDTDHLAADHASISIEDPASVLRNEDVGNEGINDLLTETSPVPEQTIKAGISQQTDRLVKDKHFSIHDITLDQVLAGRSPARQTELYKAWPSLDPKKTGFDYDTKMAEIKARPGRKARFGQKKPVDAEKVLAVVGPSEHSTWPPIDNSLGLTQEQFGDELALQPCKTWDEFFDTTEKVKPCVVDGKLAYRPVGERSRTVYKTSI